MGGGAFRSHVTARPFGYSCNGRGAARSAFSASREKDFTGFCSLCVLPICEDRETAKLSFPAAVPNPRAAIWRAPFRARETFHDRACHGSCPGRLRALRTLPSGPPAAPVGAAGRHWRAGARPADRSGGAPRRRLVEARADQAHLVGHRGRGRQPALSHDRAAPSAGRRDRGRALHLDPGRCRLCLCGVARTCRAHRRPHPPLDLPPETASRPHAPCPRLSI